MKLKTFLKFFLGGSIFLSPIIDAKEIGTFQESFPIQGIPSIILTIRAGDIRVTGTIDEKIELKGTIWASSSTVLSKSMKKEIEALQKNPPISFDGTHLIIKKIDSDLAKSIRINYEISAPFGTSLEASTGSGDVDVSQLQSPVDLSTGSGDIQLSELDHGGTVSSGSGDITGSAIFGKLVASTGSGDVKFTDCGGEYIISTGSGSIDLIFANDGKVDASTSSGDIHFAHLIGIARAHSASGDITITGYPIDDWSLKSISGDVSIDLADEAGVNLDGKSISGDINLQLPAQIVESHKHQIKAMINQSGPEVKIRTTSGDIDVY